MTCGPRSWQPGPDGIALAIALIVLALLVSAIKWRILLRAQVATISLPYLFNTYLVGLFFNNFLPSNVGGDVARIADIAKRTGKAPEATASVIGERLISGLALALTALIGLLLSPPSIGPVRTDCWRTDPVLCIRDGTFRVPESEEDYQYGDSPAAWSQMVRTDQPGSQGLSPWLYAILPRSCGPVFWSFAFHITLVLVNYAIFIALNINLPLISFVLYVPIIAAIQLVPVSVNGFGVREVAYVYFFGTVRRKQFRRGRSLTTLWDTGHAG